ncbi:hypothetical protein NQ315_002972, partial [Exocentrus adspersus]
MSKVTGCLTILLTVLAVKTKSNVSTTVFSIVSINSTITSEVTLSYVIEPNSTESVNNDDESTEEVNFDTTTSSVNISTSSNSPTDGEDLFNTAEDLGTVIEGDVDTNSTVRDETETDKENATAKEDNRQKASMKDSLRDIAYYLRAYKFNEYDRRYETDSTAAPRRNFKEFPRPPLRSLHWEVHKFCEPSFIGCVEYLLKRIRQVSLKRNDDTAVVMLEQKWTFLNNSQQITQIDEECKKLRDIGDRIAEPFEGPLERFQWRVTASYYMCWYTMKEVPDLKHLHDHCDNFANCLDGNLGPNNKDIRADDSNPFACAIYSFCPDPCCPMKQLTTLKTCWDSKENPCFRGNLPGNRECAVNRSSNVEFRDIVLNRWNVTCRCPKGREWNSRYGMCVDVDECTTGGHACHRKLEACVNLEGSFRCACKWGHVWSTKERKCTPSPALAIIKKSHRIPNEDKNKQPESIIRKLIKIIRRSQASSTHIDKMSFVL